MYCNRLACVWRAFFWAGQAICTGSADSLTISSHGANHVALCVCHIFAVGRILTHADTVAKAVGNVDGNDGALACSLLVTVTTAL